MQEVMWALIEQSDLCVLATVGEQGPHCSLMSPLADRAQGKIYLLTRADSAKFRNVKARPQVSLLVDNRDKIPGDRAKIKALTVSGLCSALEDGERAGELRARFAAQRPHLAALAGDPGVRVLEVAITSLQLLDGVETSYRLDLP